MIVKLLNEHHLEFLSLKGGCRGSSESTLVKMSNCWKSHAAAHIFLHRQLEVCSGSVVKCLFEIKGHRFDPHQGHCVVTLGKTISSP